jgi:hypothetical protein
VCSSIGVEFIHSIEDVAFMKNSLPRLDDRDSHIIHINIITEMKEMMDPNEETTFHIVKASG